jgi:cholesterol oxidase
VIIMTAVPPRFHVFLSSCKYPSGLLEGKGDYLEGVDFEDPYQISYSSVADRSLWRMKSVFGGLRAQNEARYSIYRISTGDQVYVDATAGLFDPGLLSDALRNTYHRVEMSDAENAVLKTFAGNNFCLLDDHEVRDNWEGGFTIDSDEARAVQWYLDNQRKRAAWPAMTANNAGDPLWMNGEPHGLPFFLADTRSERQRRNVGNVQHAKIMSDEQMGAIETWLSCVANAPQSVRYLASGSMLAPRKLLTLNPDSSDAPAMALHLDSWMGYPSSARWLLARLCDTQASNVVLLSGDEHLSGIAKIELTREDGRSVTIYSVHSSGMYSPFPFANSSPADFVDSDDSFAFDFTDLDELTHRYSCRVTAEFVPGDGFALLTAESGVASNAPTVNVQFFRKGINAGVDADPPPTLLSLRQPFSVL